jgi:hypothetical protein
MYRFGVHSQSFERRLRVEDKLKLTLADQALRERSVAPGELFGSLESSKENKWSCEEPESS